MKVAVNKDVVMVQKGSDGILCSCFISGVRI